MIRRLLAVLVIVFPLASNAQNLLRNSTFDTDISEWGVTTHVMWEVVDDRESKLNGALAISTTNIDFASQCVDAGAGQRYDFSVWVEQYSLNGSRPCSIPTRTFRFDWYDDLVCEDSLLFSAITPVPDPMPVGWDEAIYIEQSPQGANSVRITLQAGCAAQDGEATFYFDDASFVPDTVFKNDFELHAGKTGPKQPGM